MQYLAILLHSFLSAAILSPLLWYWWNTAVTKFITVAPQVTWWDSAILLLGVQLIPFFLVRRVQTQYIPYAQPVIIPTPTTEEIEQAGKDSK